jgi:hypothetical protein
VVNTVLKKEHSMTTKQLKITLQAQPISGANVTCVISVNGTECFNQSVPECDPIVLNQTDPSETIQFDIDVPTWTAGNTAPTVTYPVSIAVTNGSIKIENFSNNFAARFDPTANTVIAGSVDTWQGPNEIVSQPLWNGQALLERYDITYNRGPNQVTGPGEVLVQNGETVTFDLEIEKYNDTWPLA